MTGPSVKTVAGKHKTVIFRPENIGKTLDPYVAYNDEVLLKVGNYVGRSESGTSLIAVFNVSAKTITEAMAISKFPGLMDGKKYIIRAHTTGYVSRPTLFDENNVTVMIVKLPVRNRSTPSSLKGTSLIMKCRLLDTKSTRLIH